MNKSSMKPAKDVVQHALVLQEAAKKRSELKQVDVDAGKALSTQMTLFPNDVRVIPNHLAKSPLFAPVRPGQRKWREKELLASPNGFTLHVTGYQLDQADCDVFMQFIHEAQGLTLGEPIDLNRADFLRRIGRDNGQAQYLWLSSVFTRLGGVRILYENTDETVDVALVTKIKINKKINQFQASLDPDIIKMFSGNVYTYVDWEKRKLIEKRVDLSKWLQNFICSNERGMQRNSIENLRSWSGQSAPIRKFREALAEALTELERVGIISGQSFYDENSKVRWNRL